MNAAPSAGRFVVQAHDAPPLHYDLMLERDGALATWGLAAPPDPAGPPQDADPKPDHRLDYLEYEGAIAGDRGTCAIWDRGTYTATAEPDGTLALDLRGGRLRGRMRLRPAGGGWRLEPSDGAQGTLARGRPARSRARVPRLVRVLQALAVCVLVGGIAYYWTRARYRAAYHAQAYCTTVAFYRDLLKENDTLRMQEREEAFERRWLGQPVRVIGRVGAIEPPTSGTTHPDGLPVFVWMNVPNLIEEADSTPLDVRCTIPHAQLDRPAQAGAGHAHRWHHGDLLVVEGVLRKLEVDPVALRATLIVDDARAREPGPLEAHFWADEARPLGMRGTLRGINNPTPEDG